MFTDTCDSKRWQALDLSLLDFAREQICDQGSDSVGSQALGKCSADIAIIASLDLKIPMLLPLGVVNAPEKERDQPRQPDPFAAMGHTAQVSITVIQVALDKCRLLAYTFN
ncbi:MAG TPA: hypothetical protein VKI65_20795 [Gemmataceae bacterium]|nr:hypothetical protein [Gemmataceae bacterium]